MSMAIKRASYTGDPGFFDFLKGVGRAAIGAIPVVGPSIQALLPSKQPPVPQRGPGSIPIMQMPAPARFNPLGFGAPGIGFSLGEQQMAPSMQMNGACPTSAGGYHLNKSDYFLRSGEFVPAQSRWVRNRKRNPANARATSKAISRIAGAKRYASSLSRISIRKKC